MRRSDSGLRTVEEHYNASESLSASVKRLTKFGGGFWESASGGAEHLGLTLEAWLWKASREGSSNLHSGAVS